MFDFKKCMVIEYDNKNYQIIRGLRENDENFFSEEAIISIFLLWFSLFDFRLSRTVLKFPLCLGQRIERHQIRLPEAEYSGLQKQWLKNV